MFFLNRNRMKMKGKKFFHLPFPKVEEAAKKAGYRIEKHQSDDGDNWIGVEISPLCWSWFCELRPGSEGCLYDHTYSQRTGKTCRRRGRMERKLENLKKILTNG